MGLLELGLLKLGWWVVRFVEVDEDMVLISYVSGVVC